MPDLTSANVHELRRLVIFLDHPDEVARAAGHRINAHYTPHESPRRFPLATLERYARTYTRLLMSTLAGLLESPAYLALPDWSRRHAIRDAQAQIAAVTDRALGRGMRADAQVVTWTAPDLGDDDSEACA